MSLEPCPFCGKPFKRLKSHLPHCKMSPGSKTIKNNKASIEVCTTTPKDTIQKNKNKVNVSDKKLNDPSIQVISKSQAKPKYSVTSEKVHKHEISMAKVLLEEGKNTDSVKPRSKWLAKREQEKAKQTTLLKLKGSAFTPDSGTEKDTTLLFHGLPQVERSPGSQNQKQLKGATLASLVSITKFDMTTPDCLQVTRIKQHTDLTYFQTKTFVWDHIKHGFNKKISDNASVLYTIGATQQVSISKGENTTISAPSSHTENNWNDARKESSAPLSILGKTSTQRPTEDKFPLQSKTVMEWTPERTAGYSRALLSLSHSGMSSNEGSTRSLPKNQGPQTEQRLGDVRLGELAAWLGIRTPKSPREVVTMMNRGWHWYYKKYFDVQKGGIGGIAMLIASYCVLSYVWNFPQLKKERWRKYH